MAPNPSPIPLTGLSAALAAMTAAPAPGYRRLYGMALDGRLPGAYQVNSRWFVPPSSAPAIAAVLGLSPAASGSAAR